MMVLKPLISYIKLGKLALKRLKSRYYTLRVKLAAGSFGPNLKVNYFSSVTPTTHLGSNVNFNGMIVSGGGTVRIGDNFHSGSECMVLAQNHKYDDGDSIPYDSKEYIHLDVTIENNVWIGTRVMILGGVTIGEGAIIQAGSVVVSNIPKCAIAGGHPARVFKYRNIEHYELRKSQGRFF